MQQAWSSRRILPPRIWASKWTTYARALASLANIRAALAATSSLRRLPDMAISDFMMVDLVLIAGLSADPEALVARQQRAAPAGRVGVQPARALL